MKELTTGTNPRGETGCGHSYRASGKNNTGDESAEEPVKKKAKRMAAETEERTKNEINGICKRMAKEYESYTEKFERWSENKKRGLDESQLGDLNNKIKALIEERGRVWKENEEIFRKETNYGLMNLRHRAAEKHLNEMSDRLQSDIDKKSYTTCNDCGDVFSSTKILELHACDKTSSEYATSTSYESESSDNESGGNGNVHNLIDPEIVRQQYRQRYPQLTNRQIDQATFYYMKELRKRSAGMPRNEGRCRNEDLDAPDVPTDSHKPQTDTDQKQAANSNAWGIEVDENGVGMIDGETALIDHDREEIELPRGISQLGTTENEGGNVFHIQLPETNKQQHWSAIRVDTNRQTIDYKNSRLSIRVDRLKEIAESAKTVSNIVYTHISSRQQPDHFGIYISPKMTTHAFVGPFNEPTEKGGKRELAKKEGCRSAAIRLEESGEGGETGNELLMWANSAELYDLGGADTHLVLKRLEEEGQNEIRHADTTTDELSDNVESSSHQTSRELASASNATKTALLDATGARTVEPPQVTPQQETLQIGYGASTAPKCPAAPRYNSYSTERTSNVLSSSEYIENMAGSCPPKARQTYSGVLSDIQAKHTTLSRRQVLNRNRLKPGRPPDSSCSHSARAPPGQSGAQRERQTN